MSYPVFAVLKIINHVKFSQYKNKYDLKDWFESFNTSNDEMMILSVQKLLVLCLIILL